ncbi:MAG: hypothetical protein HYX66_05805 [Ignavibacteria bacterium]|nr:hypothetical protein [Ignavibacteria bacterium]
MKLLMEPIDVAEQPAGPARFCWRGRLYEVERILETWTSRTQWWTASAAGASDDKREYYLLLTTHGVMEIFYSPRGWMLSRLLD